MEKLYRGLKITGLAVLVILTCLIIFLQLVNAQKIAWGIKLADLNLGNKNISQAEKALQKKMNHFFRGQAVLNYQEKTWLFNLAELGFQPDYSATLQQAYQISHPANPLLEIKNQVLALFGYYQLKPVYQIDLDQFQEKTSQLFINIEEPAQNAALVYEQELDSFALKSSSQGATIDRPNLLNILSGQIESFVLKPITLELILDEPSVENYEVETAQAKANQILAHQPYQLIHEISTLAIDKQTLINWIKFEPVKEERSDNEILGLALDQEQLEKYLDKIASQINRPVTNARLKTEDNKAVIFVPDQDGFEVKKELTYQKLMENLLAVPPIKKTYVLADKAVPKIRLRETNQLGIQSLIGQGVSNFAGSPANRKHNIKTAVAKLNGYILSPDEEFSFINFLGETGPDQGYLPELVIKKNKTVPEYGGGVCQVSTTFFRAAVNSGLKITERQQHAFPVVYYNPQGFDATVYDP
ncbi:MAG: VanW family protein, partial [Patescibacteria group bacterium]